MSTPLILRIASKYDPQGTQQAASSFRGLENTIHGVNSSANSSFDAFQRMNAALAGVKITASETFNPAISAIGNFQGALLRAFSVIRQFRRELFVLTLISLPIINAIKHSLELEAALKPIVTRLEQIGQAGEFEGKKFIAFAEAAQRNTGIAAKETLQSLDILITKTRTAANAEEILTTAQKLHFATGAKITDVTKALADALSGNAANLAALTGQTEQTINALLRSGTLVQTLDKDFQAASERGLSTFSARIGILGAKLGGLAKDILQFNPVSLFDKATKNLFNTSFTSKIDEIQKKLDSVTKVSVSPVNLRTFEEIQIAAGKTADEVRRLQSILTDKGANLNPKEKADVEALLQVRQQEQKVLENEVAVERELATATRERLTVASQLVDLQTSLLREQERRRSTFGGGLFSETENEFNATKKRLREQIELQRETQIRLEAIDEARQIFAKRGELTEEERADIISRSENKIVEARLEAAGKENQIVSERIGQLAKLQEAQLALQKFQAENRIGQFRGADDQDIERFQERSAKREIDIAVLNAQKERDAILAQRAITAEEVERIETELQLKIEQIREGEAQRKAKKEIDDAKLTADQRKKIADDAAKFQATVEKFRTGPRKTDTQISFEIDTEKALKKARGDLDTSKEKEKLKKDLGDLLTPQQAEVKNIVTALENSLKEKKLSLNIDLLTDRNQQQELADNLGKLVGNAVLGAIKRKLNPQQIIQDIIGGAPQAGSDSNG